MHRISDPVGLLGHIRPGMKYRVTGRMPNILFPCNRERRVPSLLEYPDKDRPDITIWFPAGYQSLLSGASLERVFRVWDSGRQRAEFATNHTAGGAAAYFTIPVLNCHFCKNALDIDLKLKNRTFLTSPT